MASDLFNRSPHEGLERLVILSTAFTRDVIDLGLRSVDELINFTFSRVPHLRNPRASLDESAEHCLLGDDPCVVPGVRGDRNACRQRMW